MKFWIFVFLFSFISHAQVDTNSEIEDLKKKVSELSEISDEHSELLKRQIKDQHFDQSSRGYLELKIGRSLLNPKDVEDENDDEFNDLDDANWEKFEYANILDLEIGKTIQASDSFRHEIGIGYQHLRSKRLQASYSPSGGGSKIKITETALAHTLFARYTFLFKPTVQNLYIGPGITLGYSPISKLMIEAEQGNSGAQIYGESTSFLLELYGKSKIELTRYFYIVAAAGTGFRKLKI